MDSDGDGRTNGDELGDPDCVWKEGDTADELLIINLSHPGSFLVYCCAYLSSLGLFSAGKNVHQEEWQ